MSSFSFVSDSIIKQSFTKNYSVKLECKKLQFLIKVIFVDIISFSERERESLANTAFSSSMETSFSKSNLYSIYFLTSN